jgi:hypothetical protein
LKYVMFESRILVEEQPIFLTTQAWFQMMTSTSLLAWLCLFHSPNFWRRDKHCWEGVCDSPHAARMAICHYVGERRNSNRWSYSLYPALAWIVAPMPVPSRLFSLFLQSRRL